jgi:hypothetical protein
MASNVSQFKEPQNAKKVLKINMGQHKEGPENLTLILLHLMMAQKLKFIVVTA